jgi:hypothetical protein
VAKEFTDLRPDKDMLDTFRQNRALLIDRARKLERMGSATEIDTGRCMVSPEAEPILRELGERGDIIKTMHRALEREGLARGPPSPCAPSCTARRRLSALPAACSTRGWAVTRWASASG